MSKNEIKELNKVEIAQVNGGAGEITAKYLNLKTEDTKSGGEIRSMYLSLVSHGTK